MTVTVSKRGQMALPSALRKKYNIHERSKIELVDKGKEIVLILLPQNPILGSCGILKGVTTQDLINFRKKEKKNEIRKATKD